MIRLRRLRTWWRRVRGRCTACGGKRWQRPSVYATYPCREWCHDCNKVAMHGWNYGMGQETLRRIR